MTYKGIDKIVTLLKVDIVVADTLKSLTKAFQIQGKNQAFISDRGLLSRGEKDGHAISFYLQNNGPKRVLFIGDSEGKFDGKFCIEITRVISNKQQCIISKVERQPPYEVTCNAYAIEDCLAYLREPDFIDQIRAFNGFKKSDLEKEILFATRLPKSLMLLEKVESARKRALDYQTLVFKSIRNQKLHTISAADDLEKETLFAQVPKRLMLLENVEPARVPNPTFFALELNKWRILGLVTMIALFILMAKKVFKSS